MFVKHRAKLICLYLISYLYLETYRYAGFLLTGERGIARTNFRVFRGLRRIVKLINLISNVERKRWLDFVNEL